jgi:hypothetical protein
MEEAHTHFPEAMIALEETLGALLDRKLAEQLQLPVEVVRENLSKCRCCWSAEFKDRMTAVAAASGNLQPSWNL